MTEGNPELDPSDNARVAIGAEARRGPFFLDVELYRLSRSDLPGRNSADWAMQNLDECMGDDRTNCIERIGGDITIHDHYRNAVDTDVTGVNTRIGGGFRTGWGVVGMRAVWRRVTSAELRIAGETDRYAIPGNVVRVGVLARRGNLSAVWTASYRSGYENRTGTGTFDSWTGHDVVLDWVDPLGLEDARITAGVFQPHRRRPLGEHRQPQQRGRAHRSRLGAHLLPHPQRAVLRGKSAGPAADSGCASVHLGGGREMTCLPVAGRLLHQLRNLDAAPLPGVGAAGVEPASGRNVDGAGNVALQPNALGAARPAPGRHCRQQRSRVRMARIAEQRLPVRLLHHDPRYMTATSSQVCCTTARSWEMNRNVRCSSSCRSHSRFRIWAWIATSKRRHRFVADDEVRLQCQRAGDADALPLAARELVGKQVPLVGAQPHQREQLRDPLLALRGAADPLHVERASDDVTGGLGAGSATSTDPER